MDAVIVVALVRLPSLVELFRPWHVPTTWAVAPTAGIAARDETELEATDASTDVDVVVVELAMAVIIALQSLVEIKNVE